MFDGRQTAGEDGGEQRREGSRSGRRGDKCRARGAEPSAADGSTDPIEYPTARTGCGRSRRLLLPTALRPTVYAVRVQAKKKSVRGRVSRLRSRCAGSAGRTRGEAVWPAGAADAAPLEEDTGREGQSDRFPSRAPVCSSSSAAAPWPAGCGEAVMPFSARRSLSC